MNKAEDIQNFLAQTADLRFSARWESVRGLLGSRGYDAQRTILSRCDHAGGLDMSIEVTLPDGALVETVLRKDKQSGAYYSIIDWQTCSAETESDILARRIVSTPELAEAFSAAVERYYHLMQLL